MNILLEDKMIINKIANTHLFGLFINNKLNHNCVSAKLDYVNNLIDVEFIELNDLSVVRELIKPLLECKLEIYSSKGLVLSSILFKNTKLIHHVQEFSFNNFDVVKSICKINFSSLIITQSTNE